MCAKPSTKLLLQLGSIVDVVKQGSGFANDGKTARKFLKYYETISKSTGMSDQLLKNFYIILQVLTRGKVIHGERFHKITAKTAELFLKEFDWFFYSTINSQVESSG